MKYRTVEGHEIKVGEYYQTRSGKKVFIFLIYPKTEQYNYPINGVIVNNEDIQAWQISGYEYESDLRESDLMRPWPKEKIEVTDEIFNIAIDAYIAVKLKDRYTDKLGLGMKAALEAVFDHITNISKEGLEWELEEGSEKEWRAVYREKLSTIEGIKEELQEKRKITSQPVVYSDIENESRGKGKFYTFIEGILVSSKDAITWEKVEKKPDNYG